MQPTSNVPQSQLVSQALDTWSDVWRHVIPQAQRASVPYAAGPPVSAGEGNASTLPRLIEWLRSQRVL